MARCFFISDLHLFASRSKAWKYLDEMVLAAREAENFVLGGDIFDFRWARTKNNRQTVDRAIAWLTDLINSCPGCHFHFVLGNHDYHQALMDRLADLSGNCQISLGIDITCLGQQHFFARRRGRPRQQYGRVAGRRPPRMALLQAARTIFKQALRRGCADAIAQAVSAPGLFQADRSAADSLVSRRDRPRPGVRRVQCLLRPYAQAHDKLCLWRPGVSLRRGTDKRHEIPHPGGGYIEWRGERAGRRSERVLL